MFDDDEKTYNIFVGDLDPLTTEDELQNAFLPLGEIASVHVHHGRRQGDKNYGFVHFVHKHSKEQALKPPWSSVPIRGTPCCTRVAEGKHRSKRALYLTGLSPKAPLSDPVLLAKALSLLFKISVSKVATTDSPPTCWKVVFPSHHHSSQAFAKLSAGVFYGEPLHVHWHEPQNLQVARLTTPNQSSTPQLLGAGPAPLPQIASSASSSTGSTQLGGSSAPIIASVSQHSGILNYFALPSDISEGLELSVDRAMTHDRRMLRSIAAWSTSPPTSLQARPLPLAHSSANDSFLLSSSSSSASSPPSVPSPQSSLSYLPSAQTLFPHQPVFVYTPPSIPASASASSSTLARPLRASSSTLDSPDSNSFQDFADWLVPSHQHYQLFHQTSSKHPPSSIPTSLPPTTKRS